MHKKINSLGRVAGKKITHLRILRTGLSECKEEYAQQLFLTYENDSLYLYVSEYI